MNTLVDEERVIRFKHMFLASVDRDHLWALAEAGSKFTVPLLEGMKPLHLTIWREMMKREAYPGDWPLGRAPGL